MRPREAIAARVSMPPAPARRIDAAEKARQLLGSDAGAAEDRPVKLTTRVRHEQLGWLREEVVRFRARNPRAPRLTVEELTRVALDHLRDAQDLDGLVARYRS